MNPTCCARKTTVLFPLVLSLVFLISCGRRNETKNMGTDSLAEIGKSASNVQQPSGGKLVSDDSVQDSISRSKYQPHSLKAATVIVDYADHGIYMGDVSFGINKDLTLKRGAPSGPITVVIFRKLILTLEEKKKGTNLHEGGAYLKRAPNVFDYIGEVDLSLSDDSLAALFGVKGK